MKFSSIEEAVNELKNGKMIIVVDDEGRENEGDLVIPAENATGEKINFMIKYAKGLLCVPVEIEIAERIEMSVGDEIELPFYAHDVHEGIYLG